MSFLLKLKIILYIKINYQLLENIDFSQFEFDLNNNIIK